MLTENNYVTPVLLNALNLMRHWLRELPGKPVPRTGGAEVPWSAAGLVRAAKTRFELRDWVVVDSYYLDGSCRHSWLQKELPDNMYLVLDVNPPQSFGGPIVFQLRHKPDGNIYLDRRRAYQDDEEARKEATAILEYDNH